MSVAALGLGGVLPALGPALAAALQDEPPVWTRAELAALAGALALLFSAGAFSALRGWLESSAVARALDLARATPARASLARWLERADQLALSAGVFELVSQLGCALLTTYLWSGGFPLDALSIFLGLLTSAPLLLAVDEVFGSVLGELRSDRFLLAVLPTYARLQIPLAVVVNVLAVARRTLWRAFGRREPTHGSRRMVEDLREVIEGAEIEGRLGQREREIIENVVQFPDTDAASILVPRTAIAAVPVDADLAAAMRVFAQSGHGRVPVYEGTLDAIVGTLSARDLLQVASAQGTETPSLRSLLRPPFFVPETKRVSALLGELRARRETMAIVLDEYGGTAGLVTLADILGELIGELPDESRSAPPPAVQELGPSLHEIRGDVRIADVNAALALGLPDDEGYETLAGFVLAELGHVPRRGETFARDGAEYAVSDATDRRVVRVRVRQVPVAAS